MICPHGERAKRYCKVCTRDKAREWAQTERGQRSVREKNYRRLYGITIEEYEEQLARQNGGCAICGKLPGTRRLHVDHDHKTGDLLGILCWWCNKLTGTLRGDAERARKAADYIESEPWKRGTAVKGPIRKRKRERRRPTRR